MSQQVYIYTARADWSIAETAFQLAQLPLSDQRYSQRYTHQGDLHRHILVTEPWKLPVATHRQRVMRRDLADVACAVRILGL